MQDIVAIETARAREQIEKICPFCAAISDHEEKIITALLTAKADVLEHYAPLYGTDIRPHYDALRIEVFNRRNRGL